MLFRSNRNLKNSYKSSNNTKQTYGDNSARPNFGRQDIFTATAPYNFVPLNEKIVTHKKPDSFDKYHDNTNTGYIDLEIEAKTPIYTRDAKQKDEQENSDFYKQAGRYRIPGSSLRGMTRTMVEMISWSKFGDINNSYLYYRSFADMANSIRDEYLKKMISLDSKGKSLYQMSSGLVYKEGLHYSIIPEEKKFKQIKKSVSKKYPNYPRYYGYLLLNNNEYLVVPGEKFKPKNEDDQNDWIVYADKRSTDKAFKISDEDIWSYKNDKNRKSTDITKLDKGEFRPCFYVKWKDTKGRDKISFGHTPLFRISYEKSIGEHIMQKNDDGIDIAESIFGNETDFMTRVFFEDAFLSKNYYDKVKTEKKTPKILSGPKPTSFQLYLEQDGVNNKNYLKHYNSETQIRGNKLYWHQNGGSWEEIDRDNIKKHQTQYTKIKPINSGAKFQGRIRFENLSNVELGALLFAIDLPKGLAHKIGMAKPLGLGSIRIVSTLCLSNRVNRYKNLFAEWDGISDESGRIEQFKQEFEKYIKMEIGEQENSLWDTNRLKELRKMLDFEHAVKNIEYMHLKEFKARKVLPHPANVK